MRNQSLKVLTMAGVLLALVSLSGCGKKLVVDKSYPDLAAGDTRAIESDGFPNDISVTVEFTSSKSDITVGVFKQADVPVLERVSPEKALEKRTGKQGSFSVDVPKQTPFMIVILDVKGATEATVKARNKGRK